MTWRGAYRPTGFLIRQHHGAFDLRWLPTILAVSLAQVAVVSIAPVACLESADAGK